MGRIVTLETKTNQRGPVHLVFKTYIYATDSNTASFAAYAVKLEDDSDIFENLITGMGVRRVLEDGETRWCRAGHYFDDDTLEPATLFLLVMNTFSEVKLGRMSEVVE